MTTPDELLRLAERVEIVHGGDRHMDTEICIALQYTGSGVPAVSVEPSVLGHGYIAGHFPNGLHSVETPPLTSSLDAVEALRQRLLPGSSVFVEVFDNGSKWCGLRIGDDDSNEASASTEARARLAALLRAVAAKEA